jgi:hypothetical protein
MVKALKAAHPAAAAMRPSASSEPAKTNVAAVLASRPDFSLPTISYQALVDASISELEAIATEWRRMLTPIDLKELAVALEATLALWPLPPNWDQIGPFYIEAMREFPRDLVFEALRHVRLTSSFFPKPAELRDPILDDMRGLWLQFGKVGKAIRLRLNRLAEPLTYERTSDGPRRQRSETEILEMLASNREFVALRRILNSLERVPSAPERPRGEVEAAIARMRRQCET